jgi:peroxiredoxin
MKSYSLKYRLLTLVLVTFISLSTSYLLPQEKHYFISSNLLKKGTPAPYFEALNLDGKLVKFSDYRGKLVLLDWWYVGCKPCVKSMIDIQKIQDELGSDSFTIIGMNPISKSRAIKRFKRKFNYNHEVLLPSKTFKDAYKIRAYPTIYLIGKNGRIVYARAGYSPEFANELKTVIKQQLRNSPDIK